MPECGKAQAQALTAQEGVTFERREFRAVHAFAGNPAVVGLLPVDRSLRVAAFRRLRPVSSAALTPRGAERRSLITSSVPGTRLGLPINGLASVHWMCPARERPL